MINQESCFLTALCYWQNTEQSRGVLQHNCGQGFLCGEVSDKSLPVQVLTPNAYIFFFQIPNPAPLPMHIKSKHLPPPPPPCDSLQNEDFIIFKEEVTVSVHQNVAHSSN